MSDCHSLFKNPPLASFSEQKPKSLQCPTPYDWPIYTSVTSFSFFVFVTSFSTTHLLAHWLQLPGPQCYFLNIPGLLPYHSFTCLHLECSSPPDSQMIPLSPPSDSPQMTSQWSFACPPYLPPVTPPYLLYFSPRNLSPSNILQNLLVLFLCFPPLE